MLSIHSSFYATFCVVPQREKLAAFLKLLKSYRPHRVYIVTIFHLHICSWHGVCIVDLVKFDVWLVKNYIVKNLIDSQRIISRIIRFTKTPNDGTLYWTKHILCDVILKQVNNNFVDNPFVFSSAVIAHLVEIRIGLYNWITQFRLWRPARWFSKQFFW